MKCPYCGNEMRIMSCRTEVAGDNSPDEQTEVYLVQEIACRTAGCSNYGKNGHENRIKIYPE